MVVSGGSYDQGVYAAGYVSRPDLEEAEGFGLKWGGAGEDIGGHGSLGSGLNAVSGEGGEASKRCSEAADGEAERLSAALEVLREFVWEFHAAGGSVATATNGALAPGLALHEEMDALVAAGAWRPRMPSTPLHARRPAISDSRTPGVRWSRASWGTSSSRRTIRASISRSRRRSPEWARAGYSTIRRRCSMPCSTVPETACRAIRCGC